jgi:hypothetical protein
LNIGGELQDLPLGEEWILRGAAKPVVVMIDGSLRCETIINPLDMGEDFISAATTVIESLDEVWIPDMQLPRVDPDDWS